MDKMFPKFIWLVAGVYIFFITSTIAQDLRRLPVSSRRRLPTVIITREHLRQRQNSYGTHGDTAAEFIVSAGLDTSKNSAVRIRRIGNRRVNATHGAKPNNNRLNFRNTSFSREPINTVIRPHPQYRTPDFHNSQERNGIPEITINRRHHLNEGDKNRETFYRVPYTTEENEQLVRSPNGGYYRSPNRNPPVPDRQVYQYRPPIFVHNFQQNRRTDNTAGLTGESKTRPSNTVNTDKRRVNLNSNEHVFPIYSVKYSTSSVTASVSQRPSPERPNDIESLNKKLSQPSRHDDKQHNNRIPARDNTQRLPFLSQNNTRNYQRIKPVLNITNHYYNPTRRPSINTSKHQLGKVDNNLKDENYKPAFEIQNDTETNFSHKSDLNNKKEDDYNRLKNEDSKEKLLNATQDIVPRNPVVESANPDKNILVESPPLQSNINKIRGFQTRLIRKPSLILRDQITVNELPSRSNRSRFGPRSLEIVRESQSISRRKREAENDANLIDDNFDIKRENLTSLNASGAKELSPNASQRISSPNASQRISRYDHQVFGIRLHPVYETSKRNISPHTLNGSSALPVKALMDENPRASEQYEPDEQFSDGTYHTDRHNIRDGEVMSFSDFIASPLAEKMRLERQLFFKGVNRTGGNASTDGFRTNNGNYDSRSLKNNTIAHLRNLIVSRLLHILNLSNYSKTLLSGRSSEDFTSAEQRHIGIMVSPYDGAESVHSNSNVRILRGKIVPLPDIPQELIPLILETYKPSYAEAEELKEPSQFDDPKITENMIDNAILKLLQNDEFLNIQPVRKTRPVAYKVSRKSPSTNYVGSLKTHEPMGRPNFGFKPNEWSVEPRCDRLTEEICLDDSDYPSSAIMSSIYKDKSKFDLMYAEVKVQESQVEGLSRQQETAYSFEHYYGSYPQSSGSKLHTRDYGPHGGFVCPSEVHYARPHRAKNRKGEWKVVVNVAEYTQTMRMEKCMSSGNPCKYVVNHMQSTCSQVYSYHRLLVFSKENGLHIDAFRVPTSCACHLRPGQKPNYDQDRRHHAASAPYLVRPGPYDEYAGHLETAPVPQVQTENPSGNKDKKKSFSNTLWAILGGGQQASTLAQQPQFLDEVQKQIMWTQQLKQYPHLMKQISPNQVLKQLLEEDEDDYSIRRQRIRQKQHMDQLTSGGFASHQVPIVVPLPPPPPPPPNAVPRRPVVNMASVDHKNIFALSSEGPKIFTLSSPSEPTNTFSLTKDAKYGKIPIRPNYESGYRNIIAVVGPQGFSRINAFKVRPGMYPPQSENVQIPESSLLPVAPQFNSHSENRLKPVMKPMPAPQGSNKSIVEDEDLVAAEKSVAEDVQSYAAETVTDSRVDTQEDNDSKINFSYHPILEYLNV